MDFDNYNPDGFYDELFKSKGKPRPGTKILIDRLKSFPKGEILRRQKAAEAANLLIWVSLSQCIVMNPV